MKVETDAAPSEHSAQADGKNFLDSDEKRDLYDLFPVGYVTVTEKGLIREANLAAAALLAIPRSTLIHEPISRFIHPEDRDFYNRRFAMLYQTGRTQACDIRMIKTDGTVIWVHTAAHSARDHRGAPVCRIVISDITESKLQNDRREWTARLIAMISAPGDFRQRLSELTAALQAWSGCEAIGIRLNEGEDYPYYETRGFPASFVRAEKTLCARGPDGRILHDRTGNPILECMCGNILSGRFDPALPFFSRHGSFWTNSTTALLAGTSEADRQARTRNRCNGEGYESVALIPLRTQDQVFGLLQFNDRRPDRFSPDLITQFEQMADSLAIALSRIQTEEKLRENAQRLNFHINNSPMASIELDAEFVVTRWAGEAEKIFGWREKETIGKPIMDLNMLLEDDIPLVQKTMARLASGAEKYVISANRNITKEGRIIYCEWYNSVLTDSQGRMLSVLSRVLDVTRRKEAEEALREEQWKLQSIIESINGGTWAWNVQTGEVVVNDRWAEILGYTLQELSPVSIKTWEALAHPDDLTQSNALLKKHFSGELPYYTCECRMKHKGGHWIWVQDCGRVITRTKDGRPLMMFGTHMDITRRKQEEVHARQYEKFESLTRMAGAVAHHFNNQLYVVSGNLELLTESLPLGPDEKQMVTDAMKASHKAADVSKLMLTYLGQIPPNPEPVDLSETCRKGLHMLQPLAPPDLPIETRFPLPGPVVRAHRNQLCQVLTNLVTNAWESVSGNPCAISVTVKTVSRPDIPAMNRFPVDWHPHENLYACLEVADRGCGIHNRDIEKLFDPFYTTKFTGRGLGLPAVLGIVSAYNGGITVESRPDHGSIFRVYFPVSAETVPVSVTAALDSKGGKACGTVLLIEDEPQVRNLAKVMLTRLGYSVLEAKDGLDALELFRHRPNEIHLVLSDLTMPRMNGWETLSALRRIRPDIPVILSSGYDEGMVMAEAHPDRPDGFLGKPYHLKTLRETIDKVLSS